MDLSIMNFFDVSTHKPSQLTYLIRLGNNLLPLSGSYLGIKSYDFSLRPPQEAVKAREIPFDRGLARRLLKDFVLYRDECEAVIVHCSGGQGRSPAVAMALNDIFNFGHDTEKLMQQYPDYIKHVYETLLEEGRSFSS